MASAQSVAEWDFDGSSVLPSYTVPGATAGNAAIGSGVSPFNGATSCGTTVYFALGRSPSSCSTSTGCSYGGDEWSTSGIDLTEYMEVSVGPNSSYTMDLTAIFVDERRSPTGIRDWEVRSSLDGYTLTLGSFNVPDNMSWRCNNTVSLGASFQNLSSTVTFRIYGYNAEGGSGTWRIDNVQITGSVNLLLPVQFLSFEVYAHHYEVIVRWSTSSEPHNSFFTIERAADALAFMEVGMVEGTGTSSRINEYTFADGQPLGGTSYYRIKQTGVDGSPTYSSIRKMDRGHEESSLMVTPNPAREEPVVSISSATNEAGRIEIVDLTGRLVQRQQVELSDGYNSFLFSAADLPAAQYLVRLITAHGLQAIPFIKL